MQSIQVSWETLSYHERQAVLQHCIYKNPYIPEDVKPHPRQKLFLESFKKEILYGGAAGGGKSIAILMAALMFVEYGGYNALILRRTFSQLTKPEMLIPISHEWLGKTDAKWKEKEHKWIFPSGAVLEFGYLDTDRDKYNYQGAAYHFVGFDELTQFTEDMYTYLFSRVRRTKDAEIPLRFRATSNPGGVGHEWVKSRFITTKKADREFIPAGLLDNPSLDAESYRAQLAELDPVTRKQLEEGDWDVVGSGNFFARSKFQIIDDFAGGGRTVRYWDMASSTKDKSDFTVGVKMLETGGRFYVLDVIKAKLKPFDTEKLIKETAALDGRSVEVFMEQEPGSSGQIVIDHYARNVLKGFSFTGIKNTGNKVDRAKPLSAAVNNENVFLLKADWNSNFLDECAVFPQEGFHDDQVDSAAGAFTELNSTAIHVAKVLTMRVNRLSNICKGY